SCARAAADRRRVHERRAAERTPLVATANDDAERAHALHAEINRLPERYRVPIVLCDLEGKTCEEAARQMGRPVGTVKRWRGGGGRGRGEALAGAGGARSAAGAGAIAAGPRWAGTGRRRRSRDRARRALPKNHPDDDPDRSPGPY